MSNVKISELPSATTPATTDLVPIVQAGGTRQSTLGAIFTALGSFLAAGVGAVSRTEQNKMRDLVSAFDFLTAAQVADVQAGTAAVDVATALQAAITALPTTGGDVYLPPGIYKCTTALTVTNKPVRLLGAGRGVTVLKFTSALSAGAIVGSFASDGTQFTVLHMTIQTSVAGGGKAIAASWPSGATSSVTPSFYCDDIELMGTTAGTHYWNDGIVLTDAWNAKILNLHSCGNPSSDSIGTSLSTSAIDLLGNTMDCIITNPHIFHGTYGIRSRGTAEGVQIVNPVIVGAKVGIDLTTAADEPGHGVIGGHIAAFTTGIDMVKRTDFSVLGTLIYKQSTSTSNFIGLQTGATCQSLRFNNIKIVGGGVSGTDKGIYHAGDNSVMVGNKFDTLSVAVELLLGGDNNVVIGNACTSVTTAVTNSGTNNANHTNGAPITAAGNVGEFTVPYQSAFRSVDSAGTGTKPLLHWDQSTSVPVAKLAGGGASAVGYSMVMATAALAGIGAGNADLGGCIVWDTTNNRPIFFAPNGNRYYITPTGTV